MRDARCEWVPDSEFHSSETSRDDCNAWDCGLVSTALYGDCGLVSTGFDAVYGDCGDVSTALNGNCGLVSTGHVETSLLAAGDVSPYAAGARAPSALWDFKTLGILRPLLQCAHEGRARWLIRGFDLVRNRI